MANHRIFRCLVLIAYLRLLFRRGGMDARIHFQGGDQLVQRRESGSHRARLQNLPQYGLAQCAFASRLHLPDRFCGLQGCVERH